MFQDVERQHHVEAAPIEVGLLDAEVGDARLVEDAARDLGDFGGEFYAHGMLYRPDRTQPAHDAACSAAKLEHVANPRGQQRSNLVPLLRKIGRIRTCFAGGRAVPARRSLQVTPAAPGASPALAERLRPVCVLLVRQKPAAGSAFRDELDSARRACTMPSMGVAIMTEPDLPDGAPLDVLHIIAIVYRSEENIGRFLDCLSAQTFRNWRLIAIDNDSRDGSLDAMQAKPDPRIMLLRNARNEGFARAVNKGLAHGLANGATRFLIINDDTAFEPDFLARLVERWTEVGAAVVAPRVMFLHEPREAWYAGARFDDGWLFTHQPDRFDPDDARTVRQVEFAPGCCLAFGADVVRRIGFFDESFFVYWEDADFCMRLKAAGIPLLYLRDPSLLHAAGASSGGQFSVSYIKLYYTSYMQFLRKHFGLTRAWRSFFRITLKEASRPDRDRAKVSATIRAMLAGLVAPLRPEKYAGGDPAVAHSRRRDTPTE